MDGPSSPSRAKADINVTPLIDIVLVLLIVFIVLLPGLTRSLPVAVPRVVRDQPPPPPDPRNPPLVLTLDARGGLALQNRPIEVARLADALVPVVRLQPAGMRRVYLKVDGERPWQQVVDVLDAVRLASDRAGDGEIKVALSMLRGAGSVPGVPVRAGQD